MVAEIRNNYGYNVKVIEDSQVDNKPRLITFQLRYPRFVHAELMTHRMFSRNASSSRAIPVEKMLENIQLFPAQPVEWGTNQKGMQAGEEVADQETRDTAMTTWETAKQDAVRHANTLAQLGLHKQIANRLTEPFQFIDVLVSATEWGNWFNLRDHEDAQPEIRELARLMRLAMNQSAPANSIYHLPYLTEKERGHLDWKDSRMVSTARCARVSYRNHDQSNPDLEKDLSLAHMLINSRHMSPTEHQADLDNKRNGITHLSYPDYEPWSNNFREWQQFRAHLEKEVLEVF